MYIERHVNANPASWRAVPITGEVFEAIIDVERRLRGFTLITGFNVVCNGGSTAIVLVYTFSYIYHRTKTRN